MSELVPISRFLPHLREVAVDEKDYHQVRMAAIRRGPRGVDEIEGKCLVNLAHTRDTALALGPEFKPEAPRKKARRARAGAVA